MEKKVLEMIQTEKMIEAGSHVIVGLSGGADSVSLLLVLEGLREKLEFSLSAVHVEHGIRGEESQRDAAFAESLCRERRIPCSTYHVDVLAFAKEQGLGLEEAARIRRYACYEEEAARIQAGGTVTRVCIALAHHGDDNAETILFQMARGSGLSGFCGMQPKRLLSDQSGAVLIRPLLAVSRNDIEKYLKERGQQYCTDGTNTDVNYSRNRMRHHIMPELNKINSRAAAHISRSGAMLNEIRAYLLAQVEREKAAYCIKSSGSAYPEEVILRKEAFEELPDFLIGELVHELLAELSGGGKDIGQVHVDAVRSLHAKQVGRKIDLPGKLRAERCYEGILLSGKGGAADVPEPAAGIGKTHELPAVLRQLTREQLDATEKGAPIQIPLAPFFDIAAGDSRIQEKRILKLKVYPAKVLLSGVDEVDFQGKMNEIGKNRYTKWLNYDIMKYSLCIRNRQTGDYFVMDLAGHNKKIKAYFIEQKVPGKMRGAVWLLAEGSHVLWVAGGRMSEAYRITKETEQILEVQIVGGNEDED